MSNFFAFNVNFGAFETPPSKKWGGESFVFKWRTLCSGGSPAENGETALDAMIMDGSDFQAFFPQSESFHFFIYIFLMIMMDGSDFQDFFLQSESFHFCIYFSFKYTHYSVTDNSRCCNVLSPKILQPGGI
jgi:hypothetical protein